MERETGIPAHLTQRLLDALVGADYWGSLLKIDAAVDTVIQEMVEPFGSAAPVQGDLMGGFPAEQQRLTMSADAAKAALTARLERFLHAHSHGDDLGLKLKGEQLAAGVRFVRLAQEGAYDLVVANPPYQATSKMSDSKYIEKHYPLGKSDLYAAFLLRGLQLVCAGGVSAMLTMRNWMFLTQYKDMRSWLLESADLRALGDLSSGAFQEISAAQVVVSVSMAAFWNHRPHGNNSVALRAFDDESRTQMGETERKRAAVLCHKGRYEFDPAELKVVPEWPLVYWWDVEFLARYAEAPKLGDRYQSRKGTWTSDNARFLRYPHEVVSADFHERALGPDDIWRGKWLSYVGGAKGEKWLDFSDGGHQLAKVRARVESSLGT